MSSHSIVYGPEDRRGSTDHREGEGTRPERNFYLHLLFPILFLTTEPLERESNKWPADFDPLPPIHSEANKAGRLGGAFVRKPMREGMKREMAQILDLLAMSSRKFHVSRSVYSVKLNPTIRHIYETQFVLF